MRLLPAAWRRLAAPGAVAVRIAVRGPDNHLSCLRLAGLLAGWRGLGVPPPAPPHYHERAGPTSPASVMPAVSNDRAYIPAVTASMFRGRTWMPEPSARQVIEVEEMGGVPGATSIIPREP